MKAEALRRIREALTPEVTIQSCSDTPNGIAVEVKLTWHIPSKDAGLPQVMAKLVAIRTDEDGNFLDERGLL